MTEGGEMDDQIAGSQKKTALANIFVSHLQKKRARRYTVEIERMDALVELQGVRQRPRPFGSDVVVWKSRLNFVVSRRRAGIRRVQFNIQYTDCGGTRTERSNLSPLLPRIVKHTKSV